MRYRDVWNILRMAAAGLLIAGMAGAVQPEESIVPLYRVGAVGEIDPIGQGLLLNSVGRCWFVSALHLLARPGQVVPVDFEEAQRYLGSAAYDIVLLKLPPYASTDLDLVAYFAGPTSERCLGISVGEPHARDALTFHAFDGDEMKLLAGSVIDVGEKKFSFRVSSGGAPAVGLSGATFFNSERSQLIGVVSASEVGSPGESPKGSAGRADALIRELRQHVHEVDPPSWARDGWFWGSGVTSAAVYWLGFKPQKDELEKDWNKLAGLPQFTEEQREVFQEERAKYESDRDEAEVTRALVWGTAIFGVIRLGCWWERESWSERVVAALRQGKSKPQRNGPRKIFERACRGGRPWAVF